MRIFNTERARVSWQCRSAKSKSILTKLLIRAMGKGKRLIFLYYSSTRQRKFCFRRFGLDQRILSDTLTKVNLGRIVTMRTRLSLGIVGLCLTWLMPGLSEKEIKMNLEYSYPEPAQVPLGEKLKV